MQRRLSPPRATRTRKRRPFRLALTLAALVTGTAGLRAQTVPPAAYWAFDEGTGTVAHDASSNHHDATLQGGAGWTAGLVGSHALSLPGTSGSYADVATAVVDTTHSYSVAAWVKLNNVNGDQTFVSEDGSEAPDWIFAGFPKRLGDQSAFSLQFSGASHEFTFSIPYDFYIDPHSGFTPVAGQWYHLAGVYDAGAQSASLYVNGMLRDTIYNVAPRAATGHTGIGRSQLAGNYVNWVNGTIDDVRLYGAALSGADILAIARVGNPSLTVPTVQPAALEIDAAHPGARLNPLFNGLMIEEINYSLDGGLYGELIQNRAFKDDPKTPVHWSLVQAGGGAGAIALDTTQPVPNTALTVSLKVSVSHGPRLGAANDGYWGMPVKPFYTYRASFWAKAAPGFRGPLMLDVESADGKTVYARGQVPQITTDWAKYTVLLRTFYAPFTDDARFVIATGSPGTFWLNQVSLFRPTYRDRPNGNRIDLMEKMAAMKPHFLRMPGGNYLEGNTIDTRFEWKNTIGPIEQRPGHLGFWGYRSDDGLGLLEFLEWCEDLGMQPLLAVYAGFSINSYNFVHVNPGPDLAPYVQDALDEIQYVTGSTSTPWGARRAADGHPAPFPLEYVEIGNEEYLDPSGSYEGRFAQFYDAIKAAYPNLKLIATTRVNSRTPDLIDDHFYDTPRAMARTSNHYDLSNYSRIGPKILVGEWASQEGRPTPDLFAALGDAAWLTGLERNADLVLMEAYAPLLANVNPGAYQWPINLIGYDALRSYGSPSYYLQVMFDALHGDVVLPTKLTTSGGSQLYESVTRDSQEGTIYLKLVNMAGQAQPLHVTVNGVNSSAPVGRAVVLTSTNPQDTNTLDEPYKVVPRVMQVGSEGPGVDVQLQPYSVTVLPIGGQGHDQP